MKPSDHTRLDLIEAATRVFAQAGYHKASTREICRRAGANVAAIHYHFGDKAELYREVFRTPLRKMIERSSSMLTHSTNAREALTAFYRSMLEPTAGESRDHLMRLHAREQFEPSDVLGDTRPQAIRSLHEHLIALLCREFGLARADVEVQRLAFAIVGMSMTYCHGRDTVDYFAPALTQGDEWPNELSLRLADYACALIESERRRRSKKNVLAKKGLPIC